VTAPGAAPTLGRVGKIDEAAAWGELEDAIGEALWRYAETITGVRREPSGEIPGGRLVGIPVHLARLSAARRARQVLRAAEDAAAAAAMERGATYPTLAEAACTARQTAWKLYRPR
jgi:hypothetical protein